MSPLKPAWPFPLHPFGFPVMGPLGARRLGLCQVHGSVLEAGANWLFAWFQLGAILQFSLTRIQASFCRRKEANSPEVQFVHQYNLLLSHPLHIAPPPCCHIPAHFHASNLSFPSRLRMLESGDLLFDLAHLFSPQSVSAITASSKKSHLTRFCVANKAGSGCTGSCCSDQQAVRKHHLEANYFAVTEAARDSQEEKVWLPLLPQSLLPWCTASGHWSGKGPKSQQNDVSATKIKR